MTDYYQIAQAASLKIGNHSGLLYLRQLCRQAPKILDVGCGEGSRLVTLLPQSRIGWGIDASKKAITQAKKQYPHHRFQVADAARLPFADGFFDLTYSAFTLEHVLDPQTVISEMFRVTRPGGLVVILCPNYGAPNRRSPVSAASPWRKLVSGLWQDFFPRPGLNWQTIVPREIYRHIDDDTTVEPYLHSLLHYLSPFHRIVLASSVWDQEPPSRHTRKGLIRLLGKWQAFPFKYWGPQLFAVAIK